MKNKLFNKKSIIIICLFVCYLLGVNNFDLLKNLLFNYNSTSFNFLNCNIIISFISFMFFLILYGKGKINKNSFIYFSLIIICYNFFDNFFSHFSSCGFLILYLFLILIAYCTSLIIHKKFEYSLVFSVSLLVLLFYLLGIFNVLNFSFIFVFLISIICLFFSIFNIVKNKNFYSFESFFSSKGLIIFSILYLVAIMGGVGRYIHIWDEFSHWAFDAKVTIDTSKLTLYTGLNYSTSSLPPLLSLWHYFVSIFNNGFSEPNLYIGLSIFIFIYMMPMFLYVDKFKNKLFTLLFVIVVYGFNFLFDTAYSYSILYADLAMAFLGSAALIIYFYLKNEKIHDKFILPMLLTCICLVKSSGFVLAFTILLLIYLIDFLNLKNRKLNILSFLKKYFMCFFMIAIGLISWYLCVYLSKNIGDYNFRLLPLVLQSNIGLKLNKDFLLKFFTGIVNSFDDGIIFGLFQINLLPFLIVVFSGIVYVNKFIYKKEQNKYNFIFIFCYVVFFALTALSLFVMFSVYEASELKSFGRYLNCYHLILVNYVLFMFSYLSIKNDKFKNILIVLSIVIISFIPFSKLTFFFTDFSDRYGTESLSNQRNASFSEIINNVSDDSKIYMINQRDIDSIMPMWYARFYCYPRKVNATNVAINWKIRTDSNAWDLQDWGLTVDDWESHLIEYDFDYVFFYSVTDELEEELEDLLDNSDVNDLEDLTLFKIKQIDSYNVILEKVESN